MAATGLMSSLTAWLSAIGSSSPSTFVLESMAGFHRGVRLELEPGDVRIGSTSGADIVLRDAGIAAGAGANPRVSFDADTVLPGSARHGCVS